MDVTDGRLPCGRAVEELWESLDRSPNAHERTCADCQEARRDLREVASMTEAFVSEERESGAGPSRRLKDAVMSAVGNELRQGRRIPVQETEFGQITIRQAELARIVRDAAHAVPGVHARRTRVVSEDPMTLQVSVSVHARALSTELLALLRRVVSDRLRSELDRSVIIDLLVEDAHDD